MKKLSSKNTFLYKKIFPIIWFGFIGVFILITLTAMANDNGPSMSFLIMPIFMALFGYFVMKKLIFDLIDAVYDEGDSLLFKNNKKQIRVNLKDIKNVNYATMVNPPRVTLSIRYQTEFGDELSFSAPTSFIPFKKNTDIKNLIDRIDQARG